LSPWFLSNDCSNGSSLSMLQNSTIMPKLCDSKSPNKCRKLNNISVYNSLGSFSLGETQRTIMFDIGYVLLRLLHRSCRRAISVHTRYFPQNLLLRKQASMLCSIFRLCADKFTGKKFNWRLQDEWYGKYILHNKKNLLIMFRKCAKRMKLRQVLMKYYR
jgi:hypothetical protein